MMELRETGLGGMDWIDLAQDSDQLTALVKTVIKLRCSGKCWELLERLLIKSSAPWC
jgi:hypothetical protein